MSSAPLRLITIGPSHYCEKARWALDHAGIAYVEESHVPLVHWAFSIPRGSRTVPILVPAKRAKEGAQSVASRALGPTLVDSSEIMAFADSRSPADARLYPHDLDARTEALRLEDRYDETLGPLARRLVYCFLVPRPALFVKAFEGSAKGLERLALVRGHALFRYAMKRAFKISARVETRCLAQAEAFFDEVGTTLGTRRYLVGEHFSAADLTFAALASPMLMPDELGVRALHRDDLPDDLGAIVDRLRRTKAGEHALRVYRDHRRN